jgi:hypothetical protein
VKRRPRLTLKSESKILQISSKLLLRHLSSQATSKASKVRRWRARKLIRNLLTLVTMLTLERSNLKRAATCHQRVRLRNPKFTKLNSKLKPKLPLMKRQSMRIPLLLKLRTRFNSTFRKALRSRLPLMLLQ